MEDGDEVEVKDGVLEEGGRRLGEDACTEDKRETVREEENGMERGGRVEGGGKEGDGKEEGGFKGGEKRGGGALGSEGNGRAAADAAAPAEGDGKGGDAKVGDEHGGWIRKGGEVGGDEKGGEDEKMGDEGADVQGGVIEVVTTVPPTALAEAGIGTQRHRALIESASNENALMDSSISRQQGATVVSSSPLGTMSHKGVIAVPSSTLETAVSHKGSIVVLSSPEGQGAAAATPHPCSPPPARLSSPGTAANSGWTDDAAGAAAVAVPLLQHLLLDLTLSRPGAICKWSDVQSGAVLSGAML
ncbi:unnamed protein product [Closterium sp. Yama58-4]|nr:unnamed protein product [Closterium sp. Yama58-4]